MSEIILPPEEDAPQTPELNIDKPTTNSKVITIEFEAKKTNKVSTKDTNQQLYTTDTDAWFEFKETSLEGANGTYSVVFRNRHDGSIFQRTGDVVNGVAYYKIPHQEIRHAGAWRGQLVYTLSNGDTTSREFSYDVKGHILDGKDVREIVVEDFETLMSQLNSMKDNAELELADLVNAAERNELERQQFYESLVEDINDLQENYQELLDTGVLQTNINEKLEELEEEYAPKLNEVTAQLAQTDSKKVDKDGSGQVRYSNLAQDVREKFTGGSVAVVGDNSIVTSNLTDNVVKSSKIGRKEVTPKNTSFITSSSNLFNREDVNIGLISPSGIVDEGRDDYVHSHRIDVLPGQTLYVTYIVTLAFYDQNGEFIKREFGTDGANGFVVVPDNAYYARANISRNFYDSPNAYDLMIAVSDVEIPYEPFHQKLEDIKVGADNLEPDSVATVNVKQGAITPEKTTFIEQSTNLFNKDDVVLDKRIGPDGTINDAPNYAVSGYIPVSEGSELTTYGIYELAFYDDEYNFLKRSQNTTAPNLYTVTVPENAYFSRVNVATNIPQWTDSKIQINKGAELLPYEDYYQRLEGVDVKKENVVGEYSGYDFEDRTIPPEKTTFINQSTNLFNKNQYTANKRIGPDGSLNDQNGYAVSSPFNFNSEYPLTALGVNEIVYYDKDDIFIKREQVPIFSEPHTYTPPKEARIGRANFSLNSNFWARGEIQINKGAELLPYEEHQSTFTLSSGFEKLNSILLDDFITKDDSYMIDVPIDGVFQTQKTFPDYTNFRESTHTDIYGMMDTLMDAYPEYITSEVIGYDVLDNEIKMYRLKPERPPADKKTKMPKVFLTTGTHGPEKATVPSTYHMLKMMCEEWKNYPLLEALRFNVEWLYIPVVNPSGWNARTRENANGVDINRNYPFQWTLAGEGTGTYSGPAPLSEPETRAVNSIFESNPDIDIFCDFHNFGPETVPVEDGKFSGKNRFLWLLTDDIPYVQNMGQSLIGRLSRRWEDDFEWYASGQFAGHTGAINGGPGMTQSYAQSLGTIKFSSTLEICNTWAINPDGVSNGDDVIKAGVEAITNWILIQLKELIK